MESEQGVWAFGWVSDVKGVTFESAGVRVVFGLDGWDLHLFPSSRRLSGCFDKQWRESAIRF